MKTIVVTGASKGLGAAITRQLVSTGHSVIGVARNETRLAGLKHELGPSFIGVKGDVCNQSTLESLLEHTEGKNINGLILNAGSTWPISKISDLDVYEYRRALETSLISPVSWIQALLPGLRQSKGNILYTSSSMVKSPLPAWSPFTSARAAMHQIIASLALEEPDIGAWAIEPGVMDTDAFYAALTDINKSMPAKYTQFFSSVQKSKNFLKPEDPAESFVKLVLTEAKPKSGTAISWNEPWIKDL